MPLRIAVVQQDGNPGKPGENREKALGFARRALDRGADIILFHEELIVGYTPELKQLAEPVDGPTTRVFQGLLQGREALIIYGLTERDGEDCYISAPVVSAHGVIANYRKTHLWWKAERLRHEPTYYRAGDRLVTFDHKGCRAGLMICYDGDFPEMTRAYANLGCSVVFWMNNRGSRGHEEVRPLACGNSMIVAASCCCGPDENGNACGGGSNITDADGALLSELWNEEGIIVADVSPPKALELRQANPWYRGRRPELYGIAGYRQRQDSSALRDRLWLWGHPTGAHNGSWKLTKDSRISPVEAAHYMGIPNLLMVKTGSGAMPPDPQYLVPFRSLKRVVWSIVSPVGSKDRLEVEPAIDVARRLSNLEGYMMDDFFNLEEGQTEERAGVLSADGLGQLRKKLAGSGRQGDLWVVLYDNQLHFPVADRLALCDKVSFWTWEAKNLEDLEENFARFEELVPEPERRVLGCYMWDFGGTRKGAGGPMPLELMQKQCELGRQWLEERRLDGMVFLSSCLCDLELEAVEWLRRWIGGPDV
jgi:(R)-amidase